MITAKMLLGWISLIIIFLSILIMIPLVAVYFFNIWGFLAIIIDLLLWRIAGKVKLNTMPK